MTLYRIAFVALAFLSSANALQVPASSTRIAVRSSGVRMAMPSVDDARNLSTDEIEAEIAAAKKVSCRPVLQASSAFARTSSH